MDTTHWAMQTRTPHTEWPTGAQIEQTDRDTWIYTGKRVNGKNVITRRDSVGLSSGWYRLVSDDELSDYTYLPQHDNYPAEVVAWMFRAVQMEVMRLRAEADAQTRSDDWSILNEKLNEYADEQGLCGEYESKLDDWNSGFSVSRLVGRTKTYDVELTVTMTFTTTVEVEATSPDEASEKAGDLEWSDVTDNLSMSDADDVNWDVESATVQ